MVDDDSLISNLYQKAFTLEGYEVEIASNGEDGLNKARQWGPSLVLLDIRMPKMNGIQVLQALKADQATNKIPVVILTNQTNESIANEALAKGAAKYITKGDHKPQEVVAMVKEILATAKP